MKKFFYIALLLIIFLVGCSRAKIMRAMTVEQKIEQADKYFAKRKYKVAAEYYSNIIYEKNSIFTPKAQMYLGDCYFHQNRFMDARFEYEELARLFPDYEEINRAYYMIGVCFFDESIPAHYTQGDTRNAIDAFSSFIEKFPKDPLLPEAEKYLKKCTYKLLKKDYLNGYAYYKIYDYSAALMYFEEIIALDLDDNLDKKSLYYSTLIYLKRKNIDKAKIIFTKLTRKYPDSKETFKAQKKIGKFKS
ncbi:MAG: outer membrane protein assembly factor BamD [Candidatus Cloacimonetes bacterium]|nr:outer membrane protein assembly factor BamD [Candidatus Cloacimonadota bacterium]